MGNNVHTIREIVELTLEWLQKVVVGVIIVVNVLTIFAVIASFESFNCCCAFVLQNKCDVWPWLKITRKCTISDRENLREGVPCVCVSGVVVLVVQKFTGSGKFFNSFLLTPPNTWPPLHTGALQTVLPETLPYHERGEKRCFVIGDSCRNRDFFER